MGKGIGKLNAEGYPDPTAYEAITAIEREMKKAPYRPLVYICSPLAGDMERNLENARRYSRFAVEKGAIPLAPHLLYTQFMDDTDKRQRRLGLFFGLVLLSKCEEMWVFGGRLSEGMKLELAKARRRGMPVRFFDGECTEVQNANH